MDKVTHKKAGTTMYIVPALPVHLSITLTVCRNAGSCLPFHGAWKTFASPTTLSSAGVGRDGG